MSENSEWVTGNVRLSVEGKPLDLQMTVPAKPVKPQRMLPIFQQMTNSFVEMGINALPDNEKISCQAGCGACCSQAVPLAEIEAYKIAEMVENMPEPRRREIKERFEKAFAHFAEIGWFEKLQNCAGKTNKEQEQVILDYFREGISCPFLEDGACSIHPDRPLACREYLVTSPAENCSNPTAKTIKMVEIPIKPSKPVRNLGRAAQIAGVDFIPMVLALKWAENNAENFPEKTGEQWMADFFVNLTKSEIPKSAIK
jgi:Fe-S-cluster containining protein